MDLDQQELTKKLNKMDLSKTTGVVCESCNGEIFKEVAYIRKASRLLTGQPQDAIIPIPTFACVSCGHINKDFIPNFPKSDIS